jgi:hypothetical protein
MLYKKKKTLIQLTSTASVPLSIRSIFVKTPKVLSPEKKNIRTRTSKELYELNVWASNEIT